MGTKMAMPRGFKGSPLFLRSLFQTYKEYNNNPFKVYLPRLTFNKGL